MAEKEYIEREAIIRKLNEIGGCDASDEWDKVWDMAIDTAVKAVERLPVADVAPVKHGHWVKEKPDVLTDTDKWIEQISNMVFDVNPAEIASHIQNGTLKEWCLRWQQEMNMLIIAAPLDYSNSKEREENA